MKGAASLRILRARLGLDRQIAAGRTWLRPLRDGLWLIERLRQISFSAPAGPLGARAAGAYPCPVPFREMVINCDGTVACGSTGHAPVLDSFDKTTSVHLSDIWEGPSFKAMRARMLAKDASGCAGCMLFRCPNFPPLSEVEQRTPPSDHPPLEHVLIEPTACCDLDCPSICGRSYPKALRVLSRRKTRFMSMDLFAHIVAGIDRPIRTIGFYNYGEPLLHPNFSTMCKKVRARCPSAYIYTSTNGTRMADLGVRKGLLESGLDDIVLSVDGATQKTYGAYRRGGQLESILDGMRQFRQERERAGLQRPRLLWRYLLFSWNDSEEELALAERMARDVGVDHFGYGLSDLPDLASRTYLPGTPAFERIQSRLFRQNPA